MTAGLSIYSVSVSSIDLFAHTAAKVLLRSKEVRCCDLRTSVKFKLDLGAQIGGVLKQETNLAALSGHTALEGKPLACMEVDR